jgi:hypothetical protein
VHQDARLAAASRLETRPRVRAAWRRWLARARHSAVSRHNFAVAVFRSDNAHTAEFWQRWCSYRGSAMAAMAEAHAFWQARALMAGLDAWIGWCKWLRLLFHSNAAGLPFQPVRPVTLAPKFGARHAWGEISPTFTASPTISPETLEAAAVALGKPTAGLPAAVTRLRGGSSPTNFSTSPKRPASRPMMRLH